MRRDLQELDDLIHSMLPRIRGGQTTETDAVALEAFTLARWPAARELVERPRKPETQRRPLAAPSAPVVHLEYLDDPSARPRCGIALSTMIARGDTSTFFGSRVTCERCKR